MNIKVVVGLGNPGNRFVATRHNIGFMVVDHLCQEYRGYWRTTDNVHEATIVVGRQTVFLMKPQTFMNNSGESVVSLKRRGMHPENILVIHDELELPFGKIRYRFGGSARGHNGLRSLIQAVGPDFWRMRCGIGRPEYKEDVPDYVLAPFTESQESVTAMIETAAHEVVALIGQHSASH